MHQDTFTFTGAYGYFDVSNNESDRGVSIVTKKEEYKRNKKPFEIFPPYTKTMDKQGAMPDQLKKQ